MNSPFEPFYDKDGLQISLFDTKTLIMRLETISHDQDTGFIELPTRIYVPKVRFCVTLDPSAQDELGLWIHLMDPDHRKSIELCEIKRIEPFKLHPTTVNFFNHSRLFKCKLPTDKPHHDFSVYFPKMDFDLSKQKVRPVSEEDVNHATKKEFNLCEVFSASYEDMVKDIDYDVHVVVADKKIGSYKYALCASSDVFRAAFKPHTKESITGKILIDGFDYEIVKIFVDALHTHKIRFDDNLMTTVKVKMLASKYNVAAIEKAALAALNVMNVDQNNFVSLYK